MYSPRTRKMASMFSTIVLLCVFGELFILQTSALFYVEVTDKNANNARITLYECNQEGMGLADRPIRSSGGTSPDRPFSPRPPIYDHDMTCDEVTNRQHKKKIYSMANFYMVVGTLLEGERKIYLQSKNGKKGSKLRSVLGATTSTVSVSVGVIIMKAMHDVPVFLEVSQYQHALNFLASEVKAVPLIANYVGTERLREFVLWLSLEHYRRVLVPTDEDRARFQLFGEVLQHVVEVYNRNVRDAKQNGVDRQTMIDSEEEVASASRLLILKLMDPCLFVTSNKVIFNAAEKRKLDAEAELYCDLSCKFLAAAFKSNRVTSSRCNGKRDTLVRGECEIHRCHCELEPYMMGLPEPQKWYTMIECSNDLRIKTAAATLKTPSLATLSSIRQSFSRSKPASLWRSLSNGRAFNRKRSISSALSSP